MTGQLDALIDAALTEPPTDRPVLPGWFPVRLPTVTREDLEPPGPNPLEVVVEAGRLHRSWVAAVEAGRFGWVSPVYVARRRERLMAFLDVHGMGGCPVDPRGAHPPG